MNNKQIYPMFLMQGMALPMVISGKVYDYSTGKPMVGVNIYAQNTPTIGTQSFADGSFNLHLNSDANIIFSHLGYEKMDYPSNEIPTKVYLIPKAEELDEVTLIYKKKNPWEILGYAAILGLLIFIVADQSKEETKE